MARKGNAAIEAEREEKRAATRLRYAQEGSERIGRSLAYSRQVLSDLLLGSWRSDHHRLRHEHAEPYTTEHCGWCGNIQSWRWRVAEDEAALPIALTIQGSVRAEAVTRTQAELWALTQERYPHMTRDLVRSLWHQARTPAAEVQA